MISERVASGHALLAVEETDAQGGKPVLLLLLHAGVTDKRSWVPVVERLSARVRCIRDDRRGYGETEYEPDRSRDQRCPGTGARSSGHRAWRGDRRRRRGGGPRCRQPVRSPGAAHLPHLEGMPLALDTIAEFIAAQG